MVASSPAHLTTTCSMFAVLVLFALVTWQAHAAEEFALLQDTICDDARTTGKPIEDTTLDRCLKLCDRRKRRRSAVNYDGDAKVCTLLKRCKGDLNYRSKSTFAAVESSNDRYDGYWVSPKEFYCRSGETCDEIGEKTVFPDDCENGKAKGCDKKEVPSSLPKCMKKCDRTDNCVAAQWSRRDKSCRLWSEVTRLLDSRDSTKVVAVKALYDGYS